MGRCGLALASLVLLCFVAAARAQDPAEVKAEVLRGQLRIPEGYKPTPYGWVHASCIVELKADEIYDAGVVIRSDGTAKVLQRCLKETYGWDGTPRSRSGQIVGPSASGWLGSFMYTIPLDLVSGSWTVPSAPSAGSQFFYLFNGVTTSDGAMILQPVLQWQGLQGTTGQWIIRSWRFEDNTHYVTSDPWPVSPGQTITGAVTGSNCNSSTGICGNWKIETTAQTSPNTSVTVTTTTTSTDRFGFPRAMSRAIGGAIEGYSVTGCSQMPPNGSVTFSGTSTRLLGGGSVTVPWVGDTWPASQNPACVTTANASSMTINWNTCNNGLTKCAQACVNLQADESNCGACGYSCGADSVCIGGACQPVSVPQCPPDRPRDCCGDASICATSAAMCSRVTCN